jgi:hypothetical protein
MIRPSAVALGVLLVLPFTPTAAQVSYEPIVDVPGVVDIRWRTVIDRLGRAVTPALLLSSEPRRHAAGSAGACGGS